MNSQYILQGSRGGSCCTLISVLNALRFFGVETPDIKSKEWPKLVDLAGCKHGAAIGTDTWIRNFGLKRTPIRVGFKTIVKELSKKKPVMLDVLNPHYGTSLHSVLVVKSTTKSLDLVNFHWRTGPVVERFKWEYIPMMPPGNINRRAWKIERCPA